MAEHAIQWLNMPGYKGETLNPVRASFGSNVGWHCEKMAPGCQQCYAEQMNFAARFRGTGLRYTRKSRDKAKHFLHRPTLEKPLHWRKPRMIFWEDMSDLFGDWVPDEWIGQVFRVMLDCWPRHIFQILTKRPERMLKWIQGWYGGQKPSTNVWLGVSCSTQADADKNLPLLLECPAAIRFVSLEPLLERVFVTPWLVGGDKAAGIHWGVIGGESGSRARPCNVEDIRFSVQQFKAAGVSCFVKQLGANYHDETNGVCGHGTKWPFDVLPAGPFGRLKDPKGSDPAEWPEDLRVREWPTPAGEE